ncbi:hypothetical protein BC628DRAFT_1414601 [Trametes gibbosa]|nr:hypothetical protein BC628DRAFT_1414601 [Trametes gibbosa]
MPPFTTSTPATYPQGPRPSPTEMACNAWNNGDKVHQEPCDSERIKKLSPSRASAKDIPLHAWQHRGIASSDVPRPPLARVPAIIDQAENPEDFDRALAFASRERVSGCGLPRVLASLKRMLDPSSEDDAQAAALFVTLLSRKLLLERRVRKKVARIVDDEWQDAREDAGAAQYLDRNANPGMTSEQRVLAQWLERKAAYQKVRTRMLESTVSQGLRPGTMRDLLEEWAKEEGMSLREAVLRYRGERAIHRECCHFGILYLKPRRVRIRSEVTVDGEATRVRELVRVQQLRAPISTKDLTAELCRELLPGPRELRMRRLP